MEVRIKDNNGYVDADWTIEGGIMVVSPKVEKFEPKDGDIVTTMGGEHIFLCKDYIGECNIYAYCGYNFALCSWFKEGEWGVERYATEEEKQKFFDKLKEEGYEWDAENKKLINLGWRPKEGVSFWMPYHYAISVEFRPCNSLFNKVRDEVLLNKGWCFKTDAECQDFCNRLNQAIEGVKP